MHASRRRKCRDREERKRGEEIETGDAFILAVVLVLTAMIYCLRNMSANVALINGIRQEGIMVPDGKNGQKIALRDVLDRELFGSGEALEQLVQIAIQTTDPRVPEYIRKDFYELTASEFEKQLAKDPTNLRTQSFAGAFYGRFGQYEQALEHFKIALALSPKRQSIYVDLGMMLISKGDFGRQRRSQKDMKWNGNTDAHFAYATTIYVGKGDSRRILVMRKQLHI